jgi:hypothetical protein
MTIDVEAHARLARLRELLEDEAHAFARFSDELLLDVLVEIDETRLAVENALHRLESGRRRAPHTRTRLQRVV